MSTLQQKRAALAWLSQKFIGAIETRPNGGQLVEMFQKAVDGTSSGEPWCVGFVQFCVKAVDDLSVLLNGGGRKAEICQTEWTHDLFHKSPHKPTDPRIGDIVVWQSDSNANRGHCGIIVELSSAGLVTVEGNTAAGTGDQREGDGVWKKRRYAGNIPGFTRLGYVGVWE